MGYVDTVATHLSSWYTNMHEKMDTRMPMTERPKRARRQEYSGPWMTSQLAPTFTNENS